MTRRLLNDDPRCARQDNCTSTGDNLCLECTMATGLYKEAGRRGGAKHIEALRARQVRLWADPAHRASRLAAIARAQPARLLARQKVVRTTNKSGGSVTA